MKAPQNPTIIKSNPIQDKYVIQFAPELVNFIKYEGKVKTYRYGDKYEYLQKGDRVDLREYGTNNLISKAEITKKERVKFKDLPLRLNGQDEFESKEHQRKVFSSYYKYLERTLTDNDPFLIISFKLINI